MITQPSNGTRHPALEAGVIQLQKHKRSTKAEMTTKCEAQEAARVVADEEKKEKFQCIMDLEEEIAKEGSVDITPHLALPKIRLQPQRCLRYTETYSISSQQ
jgi:hypothetical protein